MRRVLPLFLALAIVGLGPGKLQAETTKLVLLHLADMHARLLPDHAGRGGFARVATILRRESTNEHSLILHAGDLVQGTPVSTIYQGVPIFEIANDLAFDAAAIGNHEFDYGWQKILVFRERANFPLLSANLLHRDSGEYLSDAPYLILERGGLKICLIGLITEDLPRLLFPETLGPWKAAGIIPSCKKIIAAQRSRADLFVVLGHLKPEEEDQILQLVPEVAVTISGHSHTALLEPKRVGNRIAVRAGAYGREVGRLELFLNGQKQVVSNTWRMIPVTADIPEDAAVAAKVMAWEQKIAPVVDVEIGAAHQRFNKAEVKALIEQAMREATGCDLAFMNLGGIRDVLPAGPILARHIWNILPFDNKLAVGRFKGSQLPKHLFGSNEVQPEKEYSLVTNDFVAANQHEMLAAGLVFPKTNAPGRLLRDVVIDWVKRKKEISP